MGNEMGNNTTSGLREEDNITQEKSRQEIPADDFKGQNHVSPAAEDKDSRGKETGFASSEVGREDDNVDDKEIYNKELEDDIMETEGKKSLQEAARTDDVKGQSHEAPAHDDTYKNEKETGLASVNPEGMAEPHDDNQKHDEKEEDGNMIPEGKEKSLQEAAHTNEATGKDHLVPAAKDETELISPEPDQIGIASPHIDNRPQDENENTSTSIEVKEKSLQEASSQDEVKTQAKANLDPASADENTHGAETGFVSNETDEMAYDGVDNQKEDEKEEDIKINDEAKEKSSQQAAITDDVENQDHLLPAIEDKRTRGNDTGLVSSNPEGTADHHLYNPKRDKKEEDKANAETWDQSPTKDAHANDIENESLIIAATEGEDCNKMEAEAELASGNSMIVGDTLDNQRLQGQEQRASEVHPRAESTNVEAEPSDEVSEEMQPASSTTNLEDQEMLQEFLEENVPQTSHHFENQNSMMKEDDGASNSIADAESSGSQYLIPQGPAVLEPEQLAKVDTEQLVQVCNGPQKSEHTIIPSLTSPAQENGLISDSRISTDMAESAFVDPSLKVEKEKVCVLIAELAAKEGSKEEKFELNYGDEDGNNLKQIAITIAGLLNGVGAKCNEESPGKMNSSKNDPAESHLEAILSDETQDFPVKVSKTEDEGIGLSHKAILVKEESETEDSNQSSCQIHSVEESMEQSNGKGSADGSKADEPNASPPQFMMNGQESKEATVPLDSSCDSKSSKNCQIEEAIVENGHLVDTSFNYQNEATEKQQKDSQKEVHLIIDPAVISEEIFLTDQKYKEEESEEKEIIKEIVEKVEDLNPTFRRESGEQSISHSYPIEQACVALQASPENQQPENDIQGMMAQHSNESKVEMKQESCGEFSPPTSASSFVNRNLTEKNVICMVQLAAEKPLLDLSERPQTTSMLMAETKLQEKQSSEQCAIGETPAIANGDHYQQENLGRLSTESNPHNMSIRAQMRKSPSFDLGLRIDARAEESDQTPLLYQDKTTIDNFSSQADVTLGKVTGVNTECNKNSLPYEAMRVEEKAVTLERSDSEKLKTPFLGFLKDEEEEAQMLVTPKKQDNHSATKMAIKVSAKEVTSASPKGKEKRKPRSSLFGTCMCCATVIN